LDGNKFIAADAAARAWYKGAEPIAKFRLILQQKGATMPPPVLKREICYRAARNNGFAIGFGQNDFRLLSPGASALVVQLKLEVESRKRGKMFVAICEFADAEVVDGTRVRHRGDGDDGVNGLEGGKINELICDATEYSAQGGMMKKGDFSTCHTFSYFLVDSVAVSFEN
jgi:hypothetical protein